MLKRIKGLLFGAAVVGSAIGAGVMIHEMPTATWNTCKVVQSGQVGDGTWDQLIEEGWVGHPEDNQEGLFSPACEDEDFMWYVDTATDH